MRITWGAERAEMPRHQVGSRLELEVHEAYLSKRGGGRTSSWAAVSRSMTCIVAPQCGHLGRTGDAMGVSAEIAQGMFRSAEGALGVDHPVVTEQDSEPCGEAAWLDERCKVSVELELALTERSLEASDELAAKDTSKHLDRKEEGAP